MEARFQSLEKRLKHVEESSDIKKPYVSVCASKSKFECLKISDLESYDHVFHSATNLDEGGLDTCTGVFTSGLSGAYSVSWSGYSKVTSEQFYVGLMKNDILVPGTELPIFEKSLQGRTITLIRM